MNGGNSEQARMTESPRRIGIGWALDEPGDGGTLALNLALQFTLKGLRPTLLHGAGTVELDALRQRLLAPALDEYAAQRGSFARKCGRGLDFPVLHRLGDGLAFDASADDAPGRPDIGMAQVECTDIPSTRLARAADWRLIVAGSSWSTRVLRARGLRNVVHVAPGVDTALFHPAARAGLFPGRFAVFSGGTLGYRKGHDLVIAAFRAFRRRHPEALLVCAWGSPSPDSLRELAASAHLDGPPDTADGRPRIDAWLTRHGVPPESTVVLGALPVAQLPAVLRECHLAVFPGRCEGGVPQPAMQALACAVPTVLAGNTGHLDLVGDHAYVLEQQGEVAGQEGWGECAVDELLATMERAFTRHAEAGRKGQAAARFMEGWTWDRQVDRLLSAVQRAEAGEPALPPDADQDYRWGLCLHRAGRLAEAQHVYGGVLQRMPTHVGALIDRGHARRDLGDLAGAEEDFRAALASQPRHPQALQCLAMVLRRHRRLDEAVDMLRQAVADPAATPSMHWDLAFTLLEMGRYAAAWPHFEHRHAALGLRTPAPSKPRWDGRPVENTNLLVLDEQGLGDTLQFVRFLPRIPLGPGGRVIFAGKPSVLSIVRRILPPADVFDWNRPLPRSQAWVSLMSLPSHLGVMQPQDLPPPVAIPLEPERVARWKPQVRGVAHRAVVGLCWRGNPDFSADDQRSPGLAALRTLLNVPGLRFISLQVGPGRAEIAAQGLTDRLADMGEALEAAGSNVLDTLAVLQNCDFVVSCSTSVVHMAGVMGRPGLVLVSTCPDWRWLTDRADTPWYPSLGLIRQRMPHEWANVATEAATRLAAWRDGWPERRMD